MKQQRLQASPLDVAARRFRAHSSCRQRGARILSSNVISEPDALRRLAESLVKSGYDAIAIRANAEDDAEFHDVSGYAVDLQRVSGPPIMHVSKNLRDLSLVHRLSRASWQNSAPSHGTPPISDRENTPQLE